MIAITEEQYERLMSMLKAPEDNGGVEHIKLSRKYNDELEEGKPIWHIYYYGIGGKYKIDENGKDKYFKNWLEDEGQKVDTNKAGLDIWKVKV